MAEHADTELSVAASDGDVPATATDTEERPESANGADEVVTDTGEHVPDRPATDVHDGAQHRRMRPRWLSRPRPTPATAALAIAGVALVALAGVGIWLEHTRGQQRDAQAQQALFLQVARQGALNLTTIDWQHADADVARILSSATGQFYDDFSKRSQPFVDVVKQAQSKSVGVITEAGLESESPVDADVLVAVTVTTTNIGAPEQDPRRWRMRVTVQKTGNEAKVSNVVFVP